MIEEWCGTLTLTEASSRELMRVLKEQDAEFMDALFNGKCGFTLKCTDGRSVELIPRADRKTEPQTETHDIRTNTHECVRSNLEPFRVDEPQIFICPIQDDYEALIEDEPQANNGIGCSRCEGRYDCYDRDMPHAVHCNNYGKITDEPQTERSE